MADEKRPDRCPRCGAKTFVPIAYGLPDRGLLEAAQQGKVVLGGCIVENDDPAWSCRECGWRRERDE